MGSSEGASMSRGGAIIGIGETKVGRFPGRTAVEMQSGSDPSRWQMPASIARSSGCGLRLEFPYVKPIQMHGMSLTEYLGIQRAFRQQLRYRRDRRVHVDGRRRDRGDGGRAVRRCRVRLRRQRIDAPDGRRARLHLTSRIRHRRLRGPVRLDAGLVVRDGVAPLSRSLPPRRRGNVWSGCPRAAQTRAAKRERRISQADDHGRLPHLADGRRSDPPIRQLAGGRWRRRVRHRFRPHDLATHQNCRHVPVSVLGVNTQTTHKIPSQMPDITEFGLVDAGKRAFAEAGIRHEDVDLLTVHDGFTSSILLTLELLGFVPPGEAGRFVAAGGIELGGKLPTNTHGGLISQGHVGGRAARARWPVRQLRGEAGERAKCATPISRSSPATAASGR